MSAIQPLGEVGSIRDAVEEAITTAIVTGELEDGVLVTAPDLAARFGVSPTPVREAMIELENRGFVESVRYKGFRIRGMSSRELRELVQAQQWLEGPAMALVAQEADRADLEWFREGAASIVQAARGSDLRGFIEADNQFHLGLLRLTGNERVVGMVAELRAQTRMVGLAGMLGTDELISSAEEHNVLLDLLIAGDAEGAELFMRRHIAQLLGWWAGDPAPR